MVVKYVLAPLPCTLLIRIAGDAMLKAKDIMTKELITVSPETEIVHATKLL